MRGSRTPSRGRRPTTRGSPASVTQNNSGSQNQGEPRPSLERFVDGAEDPTNLNSFEDSLTNRPLFESTPDEEDDPEAAEWSQLRCSSVQTEVITERRRRNQPSAGYPGLAFGTSVFGSNTLMKLGIISNELHNIMNVFLKRAEGELVALSKRIKSFENDLGKSEECLKVASTSLEEATQAVSECEEIGEAIETRTSIEDSRIALLDFQLSQARLSAEETDKNYKMMAEKISLEQPELAIKYSQYRKIVPEECAD